MDKNKLLVVVTTELFQCSVVVTDYPIFTLYGYWLWSVYRMVGERSNSYNYFD